MPLVKAEIGITELEYQHSFLYQLIGIIDILTSIFAEMPAS